MISKVALLCAVISSFALSATKEIWDVKNAQHADKVNSNYLLQSEEVLQGQPRTKCNSKSTKKSCQENPVIKKNVNSISSPEECARTCREGEVPKICYYHFTLELYTVLGEACHLCTPNATNRFQPNCQCVLADGVERSILTANRMIPGPSIEVCEGDKVVVDVENHMEGMGVTLHWHGIFQTNTQYNDGVPYVTQCPIEQGNTFRYQWMAGNAGTHFWHAHTGLQMDNGLEGSLIVRQPISLDPNGHLYDYDLSNHVIFMSDWCHVQAEETFPGRRITNIGQVPNSILINGKGQFRDPDTDVVTDTPLEVFTVTPGKKYRFRMINGFTSVCPSILTIEDHSLTLIATDGEPVRQVNINSIISFSAERFDFVINANQTPGAYWIQVRGLEECDMKTVQQFAILRYDGASETPSTPQPTYDDCLSEGVVLNPFDSTCNETRKDEICISQLKNANEVDDDLLVENPDVKVYLPFGFYTFTPENLFVPNTYQRYMVAMGEHHLSGQLDNITFMAPPSPVISQYDDIDPELFCNHEKRPDYCDANSENCMCIHKVDIELGALVEVILVDVFSAEMPHPFHLHGYSFKVLGMGQLSNQNLTDLSVEQLMNLDSQGVFPRQFDLPPGKDTITVPTNGYVIFRFRANNPGFWLFHCHFLIHHSVGMTMLFQVGTLEDLPPVPQDFPTCGDFKPEISPIL